MWINGTYTIMMNNSVSRSKTWPATRCRPTRPSGNTQFTIQLTDTATSPWQNPTNKYDVNADGIVSGLDVFRIINRLLDGQAGPLPLVPPVPPYLDVSGNGSLEPLDALQIINYLNSELPRRWPAAAVAAIPAARRGALAAQPASRIAGVNYHHGHDSEALMSRDSSRDRL